MKKIILYVLGALLLAIVTVLIIASTKPDTFRIERTVSIKASPDKIYPYISNLHNWATWSPFEKFDPNMKRTFSGPPNGKGAVYAWDGNSKAGSGRMEITDTVQPSHVMIKLDFLKPFEGHNITEFMVQPNGDSTSVTWSMHGPNPFISKVMGTIFNMDKTIGKEFEEGLNNLKTVSENQTAAALM